MTRAKVLSSGKYRDKTEILGNIIENLNEPKSRTKLMYDCYLSYTQVLTYIEYLKEKELITINENGMISKTNKANKLLDAIKNMQEVIS